METDHLPLYKSHKTVRALKIKEVEFEFKPMQGHPGRGETRITPEEQGYAPFTVPAPFGDKHEPKPGGYIVFYEDGYVSYSPLKAFESGYTLVP